MSLANEIQTGLACNTIEDADTVTEKAVCLAAHPGKIALFPVFHWYKKRYQGRYKFARLVFAIDIFLVGVIVGLGGTAIYFGIKQPETFSDKVLFHATVAPHDVVSGESSTLVIHYQNDSKDDLRDATLELTYPDHFLLQTLESPSGDATDDTISLGTIPTGKSGFVKIRGVMFGNVGGEQQFHSHLSFVHGENNTPGEKLSTYTFQPVRSTLALNLELPDRLVAFQPTSGFVHYKNTGSVDFPAISLEPEWPEGFTFVNADEALTSGQFILPAIKAGEEGVWKFNGRLGDVGETVTFVFQPSFWFGDAQYRQETLTHTSPVVPLPLVMSHSLDTDAVRPGSKTTITIGYENRGDEPIRHLTLGIEPTSPFVTTGRYEVTETTVPALAEIAPGVSGTVTVSLPLRASIQQSEVGDSSDLKLTTRAYGSFDLGGEANPAQRVTAYGTSVTTPLVTSVVLDSFGRYTAPSGDQLGRGPLPPLVGETTKYWIFWNVRGSFSPLTNVHIEGELGQNVVFTGRETVSQNGGVNYDTSAGTIKWSATRLEPTLSTTSAIVGIAFELALTPDTSQAGTIATLLKNIRLTGTDANTGAFVSASGANVTTNLPSDAMATGLGVVE